MEIKLIEIRLVSWVLPRIHNFYLRLWIEMWRESSGRNFVGQSTGFNEAMNKELPISKSGLSGRQVHDMPEYYMPSLLNKNFINIVPIFKW